MRRPLLVSAADEAETFERRSSMQPTRWIRETEARKGRTLARIAGLVFYLFSAQALLTAGVGLQVYFSGGSATDLLLPAASVALAVCYGFVGYYLRRYRVWARNFAFAFSAALVFAFPYGTALGALVVLCLARANRAAAFGSRPVAAEADLPVAPTQPAAFVPVPLLAVEEAALPSLELEYASEHAG
jgi:hypothetical protein